MVLPVHRACIFLSTEGRGWGAEAAKNRGVPAHSPKAGIRLSVCCLWGCCRIWRRGAGLSSSPKSLAPLLFVSGPYGDRKRLRGWETMAHSLGVSAWPAVIGDTGSRPGGGMASSAPRRQLGTTPGELAGCRLTFPACPSALLHPMPDIRSGLM